MSDPIAIKQSPFEWRKKTDLAETDKKLHEVAELYEEQFLREIIKAMRGTVPESKLIKASQGEQIYREQLDQAYVEQWGKQGGLGLQKIIYNQLVDRFGGQLGLKKPIEKPSGPIPFDEHKPGMNFFAPSILSTKAGQQTFEFQRVKGKIPPRTLPPVTSSTEERPWEVIKNPWAGKILGTRQINQNEYVFDVIHDNGLKSRFVFRGSLPKGLLSSHGWLQGGAPLGLLNPEAQSFFWTVEHQATE